MGQQVTGNILGDDRPRRHEQVMQPQHKLGDEYLADADKLSATEIACVNNSQLRMLAIRDGTVRTTLVVNLCDEPLRREQLLNLVIHLINQSLPKSSMINISVVPV